MELLALFIKSFLIGFSGAMMPGPLLAVSIAETPRHGWKTGPILSGGHAVAEIAVVVVLSFGVFAIAGNAIVTQTIGIVGGLALLLMGGSMALDIIKKRVVYEGVDDSANKTGHVLAGEGITATLSNPYWFVWWATIGLTLLVESQKFGWVGPVVFYFGHIMSDFVWYTFVTILLWTGKKLLAGRPLQVLILLCALFLIYLGISYVVTSVQGAVSL